MSDPVLINPADVVDRVGRIRERIGVLASHHVALVAVTKTFGFEALAAAALAGCDAVGENYAQELLGKLQNREAPLPVHFIGGLQTNKVRQLVPVVDMWESIDRSSLIDEVARRAPGAEVLIQVNTTGEDTKSGCAPLDAPGLVERARESGLNVRGLMTIGPTNGARTECETAFRSLRLMADSLDLEHCSMGMTADFEIAVACGSTMVRMGSALFGPRS